MCGWVRRASRMISQHCSRRSACGTAPAHARTVMTLSGCTPRCLGVSDSECTAANAHREGGQGKRALSPHACPRGGAGVPPGGRSGARDLWGVVATAPWRHAIGARGRHPHAGRRRRSSQASGGQRRTSSSLSRSGVAARAPAERRGTAAVTGRRRRPRPPPRRRPRAPRLAGWPRSPPRPCTSARGPGSCTPRLSGRR